MVHFFTLYAVHKLDHNTHESILLGLLMKKGETEKLIELRNQCQQPKKDEVIAPERLDWYNKTVNFFQGIFSHSMQKFFHICSENDRTKFLESLPPLLKNLNFADLPDIFASRERFGQLPTRK